MFPPVYVQLEALLFPCPYPRVTAPFSPGWAKFSLHQKEISSQPRVTTSEGWECMAGLTPPWPRPWWGELTEVNPGIPTLEWIADWELCVCHCLAPSALPDSVISQTSNCAAKRGTEPPASLAGCPTWEDRDGKEW